MPSNAQRCPKGVVYGCPPGIPICPTHPNQREGGGRTCAFLVFPPFRGAAGSPLIPQGQRRHAAHDRRHPAVGRHPTSIPSANTDSQEQVRAWMGIRLRSRVRGGAMGRGKGTVPTEPSWHTEAGFLWCAVGGEHHPHDLYLEQVPWRNPKG